MYPLMNGWKIGFHANLEKKEIVEIEIVEIAREEREGGRREGQCGGIG